MKFAFRPHLARSLAAPFLIAAWLLPTANAQFLWEQLDDSTAPAARFDHTMTMVHPSQDVLVFGGTDGGKALGDTWTWGHETLFATSPLVWTKLTGAGPPARHGHTTARMDLTGGAVLFGGVDGMGRLLGDTWRWNGSWAQLSPSTAPSARAGHGMAIDEMTASTVYLFGGRTDEGLDDELWRFEGGEWTQVVTSTSPPPREGHSLVWDGGTGGILLVGGRAGAHDFDDEWLFDGTDWRKLRATGAPSLHGVATGYASNLRRRSMFVGGSAGSDELLAVERRDDGLYLPHGTLNSPAPRSGHEGVILSFHPLTGEWRNVMLVFGGRATDGRPLGDFWVVATAHEAAISILAHGCGPGPWGPSGPSVFVAGPPILGGQLDLHVMAGAPGRAAILLIGEGQRPSAGLPCGLMIRPSHRIVSRLAGASFGSTAEFPLEIPFEPTLRGTTIDLQVIALHATGPAFSDAIRLHIGE